MLAIQEYHSGQDSVVARGTTNYDIFRFDPQNRPIDRDHLQKLYDSIVKRNLLREFPILVDENLTVIDGQHRLKAASEIGVPIYYIVSQRISMDDIVMTTDNVSKWKNVDYLHRWCAAGKSDYVQLRAFWHKYKEAKEKKFLSLNHSMNLCHYGDRLAMNWAFREGKYVCNDMSFAQKTVDALLDYAEHVRFFNDTVFFHTISNLAANAAYDHDRMMRKMKYLSTRLVKCADMDSYMDVISSIYNYKESKDNHVLFYRLNSNDKNWRVERKRDKS